MANRLQDRLRSKLGKKFGEGGLLSAGDLQALGHIAYGVSPQCLALDIVVGRPGFPAGRLTEVAGHEGRGKSSLCYHLLAECQRLGGVGVLLESEPAFEVERLHAFCVNTDDLLLCQPRHLEDTFEMIKQHTLFLREEEKVEGPIVMVVDSIGGLATEAEYDGDFDDKYMAAAAKVLSLGLKKIMTGVVAKYKIVLVFVNHLRATMNLYGEPYESPGGSAIRFYSTVRLRVHSRKSDLIKMKTEEGERTIGVWTMAQAIKNKIGLPYQDTKYKFDFLTGIDQYEDTWVTGLATGLLSPSGKGFVTVSDKGDRIGHVDWPNFVDARWKNVHKCREWMTRELIERGVLGAY